jgi:hypothetical protein
LADIAPYFMGEIKLNAPFTNKKYNCRETFEYTSYMKEAYMFIVLQNHIKTKKKKPQ